MRTVLLKILFFSKTRFSEIFSIMNIFEATDTEKCHHVESVKLYEKRCFSVKLNGFLRVNYIYNSKIIFIKVKDQNERILN